MFLNPAVRDSGMLLNKLYPKEVEFLSSLRPKIVKQHYLDVRDHILDEWMRDCTVFLSESQALRSLKVSSFVFQ